MRMQGTGLNIEVNFLHVEVEMRCKQNNQPAEAEVEPGNIVATAMHW